MDEQATMANLLAIMCMHMMCARSGKEAEMEDRIVQKLSQGAAEAERKKAEDNEEQRATRLGICTWAEASTE
jgi:hypothetical protein